MKGNGHGLLKVLTWHLHEGMEENNEKPVTIVSVPSMIQTNAF
jgi:hypothetical protein